eukprot:TRINITY_DN1177_c0_g1_i1.p1 TRINITY_DN1177_c0_g1~~TRINITY_DN1177_c0_g1_i1.p1  ORF type:complete len:101 (-),score=32.50 TRINITY_DN1177_c0_g1_i1:66-368(-)
MARKLVDSNTENVAKKLATVKAVGWVLQILAHQVFEGRAPALLDNLLQAIVLAPYFVLLEVLFYFGYRPDLQAKFKELTNKKRLQWKQEKERKEAAELRK